MKITVKYNTVTHQWDLYREGNLWLMSKSTEEAAEEFAKWLEKLWALQD
jgi:hypothetical protein